MAKGFKESNRMFRHGGRGRAANLGPRAGAKRAVNLSVDAEILEAAKAMEINLSQVLEDELRERVKDDRNRGFQEEHREAIASYNRFIAKNGIWSKKYRKW